MAGARADVGRLRSRFGVLRGDREAGDSVTESLFPEKSWARSQPPKRQLWAVDAVGGGAPAGLSVLIESTGPRPCGLFVLPDPPAGRCSAEKQ